VLGGDGIKITKWIPFEEYNNYTCASDMSNEFWENAYNAVLNHCKENNIKVDGFVHQQSRIPVIDDTYAFMVTFRTWGGLMAEIWGNGSDKMGYCEFAWSSENDCFNMIENE